ncbi:MAG: 2-amino-4-hydroxy-6-hydroxymethyldihydropteridine diphosphokinase [Candidatus Omnitrophica bacterium]|nr:2-amino-4-hydroxy-6-hydroxymethyldihydropteridine diphosphokinase [Candidatus Omnitrophota bacterium]
MVVCYIAVGSNLGDREGYIKAAIQKLRFLAHTKIRKISKIIETKPQGGPPQGPYLNAVIEIETELLPYELLQELQRIEQLLGRIRTVVNGPRTIDLDILTYGDVCINEEALCIPHPRIFEREFVLEPLKEIAPHMLERIRKLILKTKPKKVEKTTLPSSGIAKKKNKQPSVKLQAKFRRYIKRRKSTYRQAINKVKKENKDNRRKFKNRARF